MLNKIILFKNFFEPEISSQKGNVLRQLCSVRTEQSGRTGYEERPFLDRLDHILAADRIERVIEREGSENVRDEIVA